MAILLDTNFGHINLHSKIKDVFIKYQLIMFIIGIYIIDYIAMILC